MKKSQNYQLNSFLLFLDLALLVIGALTIFYYMVMYNGYLVLLFIPLVLIFNFIKRLSTPDSYVKKEEKYYGDFPDCL